MNLPLSTRFQVRVNGAAIPVRATNVADFTGFDWTGPAEIVIDLPVAPTTVTVRPLRLGLQPELRERRAVLHLAQPVKLSFELPGQPPLFLFADPPAIAPTAGVHYFAGNQVHDVGVLQLRSGETVYLERNAIVRGAIHAVDAEHIRITGPGILDGTGAGRPIMLENCRDAVIENLTMVQPTTWMITLGACDRVQVRHVKQIGECVTSDGIDVAGSRDVTIEDCFLTNNDDCIAIKALDSRTPPTRRVARDWRRDVANVVARRCTLLNRGAGNTMEIGFELRTDEVRDIVFEDIDVIGAHVYAAIFSIHNGDRATVRRVRYENIRVEHYFSKLVDFRILNSRYSRDAERGQIRDVLFKNVRAIANTFNTPSLIGGWDADHTVTGVTFEDFQIGDRRVQHADDLQLFTRHAHDIQFC